MGYDAVVDYDWPDYYQPYPDVFNTGVMAAKKGSEFIRKSLNHFKQYKYSGKCFIIPLDCSYPI